MPFLWILFAVLVLLLTAGFAGFQFACVKRCLPPEPLTEDYIRRSSFAKWTDSLFFGVVPAAKAGDAARRELRRKAALRALPAVR